VSNVGNWIGERTNTVGQGAITLGGRISDRYAEFASQGDGEYWYSIVDGDNRESGICNVVSTILTRSTIHSTLTSGTYNDVSPPPLNLSGSATVFCTFNKVAFDQFLNAVAVSTQNAADIDVLQAQAETFIDQPYVNEFDNAAFLVSQRTGGFDTFDMSDTFYDANGRNYGAADRWYLSNYSSVVGSYETSIERTSNPWNQYKLSFGGTINKTELEISQGFTDAFTFDNQTINISCTMILPAGSYDITVTTAVRGIDGTTNDANGSILSVVSDGTTPVDIDTDITIGDNSALWSVSGNLESYFKAGFKLEKTTPDGTMYSGDYIFSKMQLTRGSQKKAFLYNDFDHDLNICKKYYLKSYPYELKAQDSTSFGDRSTSNSNSLCAITLSSNSCYTIVKNPSVDMYKGYGRSVSTQVSTDSINHRIFRTSPDKSIGAATVTDANPVVHSSTTSVIDMDEIGYSFKFTSFSPAFIGGDLNFRPAANVIFFNYEIESEVLL
jgi:hypothetical protein